MVATLFVCAKLEKTFGTPHDQGSNGMRTVNESHIYLIFVSGETENGK